jgi:glucosamine--fructose-6-phosphate aminotransferase (isomerizing)
MCGIVGAISNRNIVNILTDGLKKLEYRGYDSSGVAIIEDNQIKRTRSVGKVKFLVEKLEKNPLSSTIGIAHTRWATHGAPSERNAHPHVSSACIETSGLAVVHNGIIENYEELRDTLINYGYIFTSDTDTEVIAHLVHYETDGGQVKLLKAVQKAVKQLRGAYGTVIMEADNTNSIVVARSGSPLVIGQGEGENFIASDITALLSETKNFMYLEEGDVAEITKNTIAVFDHNDNPVERAIEETTLCADSAEKGDYEHYMLKEIHEQPACVFNTLSNRIVDNKLAKDVFGEGSDNMLPSIKHVQIIACGTSYNAGMVAKYWLESMAGVSCNVEIASEFRYRDSFVHDNSLLVTISQSGETADTLAALRLGKEIGYKHTLCICNVDGSSLVRESDMVFLTNAGKEIGVASTKAFTTQLSSLLMLTAAIGQYKGMSKELFDSIIKNLLSLPNELKKGLELTSEIKNLASDFADKHTALFLGRDIEYPVAMEAALKLKEISYIHAEAYAAGELKHGPLALIDDVIPVIVVAPNDRLIDKLHSNVEEVRARGGLLYVFADKETHYKNDNTMKVITVPSCDPMIAPIIYTVPLQLLSYYVALVKETDVDQPRNLAKSVCVE